MAKNSKIPSYRIRKDEDSNKFFIEHKIYNKFLFLDWETWEYFGERSESRGYYVYSFDSIEAAEAEIKKNHKSDEVIKIKIKVKEDETL